MIKIGVEPDRMGIPPQLLAALKGFSNGKSEKT
jgi:hypothetical protein